MPCPHSKDAAACEQCSATRPELRAASIEPAAIANTHIPETPGRRGSDVLHPGANVGRYVISAKLGQGGMGIIYVAWDPQLSREVALKLLRGSRSNQLGDSDGHARLLREAQAMAQLSHPNVLPVYDVGTHGSSVF